MNFPDCNIAVLNQGPVDPDPGMWYNGKARRFPIGKATIIPAIEAYHHFAAEVKDGKVVRDKRDRDDKGLQTQYASRVASLSPYGLIYGREKEQNPAEFQAMRDWFSDGLKFKVVRATRELEEEEFARIK
jgi:hypothetical protein